MSLAVALTVEYPFRASDGALRQPCPRSPAVGYRTARSPQDRDVCKPRDCGDSHRSWQAVVQDMTRFLLDRSMPRPTEPNYGVARLIRGQVQAALNNFSTPNAENARRLLQSVGFDPRPYWTWTNGALGRREVTYKPAGIEQGCGIGSGCDMPYHTATKSCRRPTCSARGRCGLFETTGPISDLIEAPLRCPFPDGCRAVSRA